MDIYLNENNSVENFPPDFDVHYINS